jgi:hypothetical protein
MDEEGPYQQENSGRQALPGECLCVCTDSCPGVLSALKARSNFDSEGDPSPSLGAWLALGTSHSRDNSSVLSPADIQDKEDTQQGKARCLLKIRQHLKGFISFIARPTSINPHSETIGATVREDGSNGSKLPLYIQER